MTKRLILIRHAKSSWDQPGPDHDRPLNKRGYASAKAIGSWLKGNGYWPQEVWCSTAKRTAETCEHLGFEGLVNFTGKLYHASPEAMVRVFKSSKRRPRGNDRAQSRHQLAGEPACHSATRASKIPALSNLRNCGDRLQNRHLGRNYHAQRPSPRLYRPARSDLKIVPHWGNCSGIRCPKKEKAPQNARPFQVRLKPISDRGSG